MAHKEDSLWTILNNYIKERGQITYGELCQKVAEEGYKVETATRRLRKSESPNVEAIRANSKRNTEYISGYKWIGEPETPKEEKAPATIKEIYDERHKVEMIPKGTLFTYKVHEPITKYRDPS